MGIMSDETGSKSSSAVFWVNAVALGFTTLGSNHISIFNLGWCEELTYWKRPWCWERLRAGGEGDDTGWDGWMASPTQWTWVWVDSRSWWWTGRPGMLRFMGSQRVGHDWMTELNWTELAIYVYLIDWKLGLLYTYNSGKLSSPFKSRIRKALFGANTGP